MPNWVFNTLNNYPKGVYEKYKNDEESRAIDFNKIIPEPQEITNAPSTSFNEVAKQIYQYDKFMENVPENEKSWQATSFDCPLQKPIRKFADNVVNQMGHLAIAEPDKSLNQIFESDKKPNLKNLYDQYVEVFGNVDYEKFDQQALEKYVKVQEKRFQERRKAPTSEIKQESLNELGEHLTKVKEKYGFDNWYDWRVANWGTKWNAVDSDYDEKMESIKFDTAWAIPYPIIAKIADENPDVKLDGYSEEETGWFEEYETNDGKLTITGTGEYQWDEETDESIEVRDAFTPVTYTYAQIAKESIEEWQNVKINIG